MEPDLRHQLDVLPQKSKAELSAIWKEALLEKPPTHLRRGLLVRLLAYKIQEKVHGGLKPETQKRLRMLARKFAANPNADIANLQRIKPGTWLVRSWKGQDHHVTVLENSFEYAGVRYSNLSKIARVITGTRWSGPLFFGLKSNGKRATTNGQ